VRANNTMKWNALSYEDKILIKTCGNLKDFPPDDPSRNTLTKMEKTNVGRHFAKVAHNQFDRAHCRKRSATVIAECRQHSIVFFPVFVGT